MQHVRFEWDARKSHTNKRKHGVSFEDAESCFFDEAAVVIDDPDHSDDEERFVLLGVSVALRVLVVCHCYREEGGVIRIVSARKAQRAEREAYQRRWRR